MHSFFKFLSKLNLIFFFNCFSIILYLSIYAPYPVQRTHGFFPPFVSSCSRTGQYCFKPVTHRCIPVLYCQLPFICYPSNPRAISPASQPAACMPVYINHMWQCLLRTTPDLTLAPPLPGGRWLSCSFPFSTVPVHIVYFLSLNLRQSYHCTYFFKSRALPIYMCTTCAPLRNLVQPSTCAPLRNLVQPSTCAPLRNLVHHSYSCTSNHYRVTSCSLTVGTHTRAQIVLVQLSCTTYSRAPLVHHSCTSRAKLILVHLSCTTHTHAPLVHQSYSCTNRTHAPIVLVHPSSSPLIAPFMRDLDLRRGKLTTFH